MMATAHRESLDQFRFVDGSEHTISLEDLQGEARLGEVLARAMIQHIRTMRAVGYEEEIVLNGEVWNVAITRKSPTT